jgi:hypothetical protein
MDYLLDWFNLSNNRRVKFVKINLIGEAHFYWKNIEDCLEMKGNLSIIDYIEMK